MHVNDKMIPLPFAAINKIGQWINIHKRKRGQCGHLWTNEHNNNVGGVTKMGVTANRFEVAKGFLEKEKRYIYYIVMRYSKWGMQIINNHALLNFCMSDYKYFKNITKEMKYAVDEEGDIIFEDPEEADKFKKALDEILMIRKLEGRI